MPLAPTIQKVLVIGSGPIVIGQAAEFDYAGAQACRVLKEAGVSVVLVNSNPATIMTDQALADVIYLEPLTVESIQRIIIKEQPDSLLAGLGGQTALTLAMQLSQNGFLEQHHVTLIGSNLEAIQKAEDRQLFKETMAAIHEPTIPSDTAEDVVHALEIAEEIGYPVIVRPAFTLGGAGGGVANNPEELKEVARIGLEFSPITQILVEKYIYGWKEIEFETMRDGAGNVIAVCSMENLDPVGIHTGDSIVVAPALTLADKEFQMLRSAALNIITALGIVGGCNCQFALDPESFQYAVIEVNPRVSRSSALASKATGYPIAKIATKLALGYTLPEIQNDITGKTCACFEPTLDYVVVKFPKWPFDKFAGASRKLGTQMKATGEVMAIGTSFEMALMKAIRGAEIAQDTLNAKFPEGTDIRQALAACDDQRIFTVFQALKQGIPVEEIHSITRIDQWFLYKLKKMADFEVHLQKEGFGEGDYEKAKQMGYPDAALKRLFGWDGQSPMTMSYKMVDTCGAEFEAETPYFYATTDSHCESRSFPRSGKPVVIVLGSGPIRIGQGIEFDYSSVHCVWKLKELGYDVVIINNNPETVSTDYDTADRLYFEPLTPEDVMQIIQAENPVGVVVAFGGQTAIKLTGFLQKEGIPILGTSAESIDIAEDRERFDALLETFQIQRPKGMGAVTFEEALQAANCLGYPVLLRPSYVIGGQNMRIVHNDQETSLYMRRILNQGIDNPVLVDKYMMGAELEVDVISDGEDVLIPGIMQHIERAGVHSGDSIAVYPPYNIDDEMMQTIVDNSTKLALSLGTKGLVNIQYLIDHGELYVIEVNPRASRTVPYISKVTGVPMVDLATSVMVGKKLRDCGYGVGLHPIPPYVAVKVPVFSFEKLTDVNAYLGPEMKSTGEVLGIGKTLEEALFKGLTSAGMLLASTQKQKEVGVLISVDTHDIWEVTTLAKKLDSLGFFLYATEETAGVIASLGIAVRTIPGIKESQHAFELLDSGKIHYIVYTGALLDETVDDYIALHRKALQLSIPCFTSLDTANALADIIGSRYTQQNTELVDLNHMRKNRQDLPFTKMHAIGNDYIVVENFGGEITCPESLCISLCNRYRGVGGYGIILLETSPTADAKVRVFTRDGGCAAFSVNALCCSGKYLYDNGFAEKKQITLETENGVKDLQLFLQNGKVSSVRLMLEKPVWQTKPGKAGQTQNPIMDTPFTLGDRYYRINCFTLGCPHCVVFVDRVEKENVQEVGKLFSEAPEFAPGLHTEFVKVVNPTTLIMRAYEPDNGETAGFGTGACAAVAAAIANHHCAPETEITVKMPGGELLVMFKHSEFAVTVGVSAIYRGISQY